jgi:hypothetical protein
MEHMMRNWNNFAWLSGDHIVEQHVHNIDVINWFTQKTPQFCYRVTEAGNAERLVINMTILVLILHMATDLVCIACVVRLMTAPMVSER